MSEFEKLKEVIARLRGEDGCPWDREQTLTSHSARGWVIQDQDAITTGIQ